jgi:hypothetical protein
LGMPSLEGSGRRWWGMGVYRPDEISFELSKDMT